VVKTRLAALAAALFIPAAVGLLYQAAQPEPWPYRLLSISLMLMSLEQAHMARFDLRQVDLVERHQSDPRLQRFRRVVWLTIVGQVVGFSVTALGHLGWGMALILLSLVGFNLAAGIRLEPGSATPIQAAGWRSRFPVLVLDVITLVLALLWMAETAQPWVAGGVFTITMVYGSSKVLAYVTDALRSRAIGDSAIHVAHTAQEHPQPPQQN
jgi:hypothetical protein